MSVGELNIGDLVRFNYTHGDVESDMGIILDISSHDVIIHWREEEEQVLFHEESEVSDWLTRGLFEVVSENQ
jgi:hypothetical protein